MKFGAFVTSSAASGPAPGNTFGVDHEGCSSRGVFQATSPFERRSAIRNEPFCWSHCTMTRSFQMIGELALPHS